MHSITCFIYLAFGLMASAHMELSYPVPFRSAQNKNSVQSTIDYSMTSPLNADGSNFPCKGYQTDMGTPAGASVASWAQGETTNFTVIGGATHGGGSCQAALSYDQGKSFTVINSFVGSCPMTSGESFPINIPSDAKTGPAMFAWVWYNQIGNREIYMNCASVTITAASSNKRDTATTAFSSRPDLFVANLGNGCTTVEGKDVDYPNPGPSADVQRKLVVSNDSGSFTGTCAAVKGIGGGSSNSASGSGSSGSASPSLPASGTSSTDSASPATSTPSSTAAASSPATTSDQASATSTADDSQPTGGVFQTSETPAPTSSATSQPTSAVASPVAASSPSAGLSSAATPLSTGSSSPGAMAVGATCSTEGMWNCIGGTSFQQCASGFWSVAQAVAPGTTCTTGQSMTLNVAAAPVGKRTIRRSFRA